MKAKTSSESGSKPAVRKAYSRPAIIHSERTEARAVLCNKGPSGCITGPAHS